MTVLVYSEQTKLASELVSAAFKLSDSVYALSLNNTVQAEELSARGVQALNADVSVVSADTAALAQILEQAAMHCQASVVLISSEKSDKHLAGRLAQRLQAGCLTDVEAITGTRDGAEYTRNALGGATVAVQTILTEKKVVAVAPKAFDPAPVKDGGSIIVWTPNVPPATVELLESKIKQVDSVDITAASVLFAVGQGVEQELLSKVQELARRTGAELACSKPIATDKKWLPEARVVGISGSKCKPDIAVLFGISGQVQFYVGIRDAKNLFAVNSDENAPICGLVDYTLIADAADVIADLQTKLS